VARADGSEEAVASANCCPLDIGALRCVGDKVQREGCRQRESCRPFLFPIGLGNPHGKPVQLRTMTLEEKVTDDLVVGDIQETVVVFVSKRSGEGVVRHF